MSGLHAPHPVPAPQRRPTSFTVEAPAVMVATSSRSVTLAQRHTIMGLQYLATLRIILNRESAESVATDQYIAKSNA
jgi:hypothetical protein